MKSFQLELLLNLEGNLSISSKSAISHLSLVSIEHPTTYIKNKEEEVKFVLWT